MTVHPPRACSTCAKRGASSGCSGLLPALFSRSDTLVVTVHCKQPTLVKPGDSVELDIEEPPPGWWRLAATAYLAPVTGLLAGALIGSSVTAESQALADTLTGTMAFAGLLCGWSGGRYLEHMLRSDRSLFAQPPVVRLLPVGGGAATLCLHTVVARYTGSASID